jgi:formylglycine-generating enzyme
MHHVQTFKDNPFSFTMRHVEGGTFDMGSNDKNAHIYEQYIHPVSLHDYWMGELTVTQALWAFVMKDTDMAIPSHFEGDNYPVESVSWEEITKMFLPKLNKMTESFRPKDSLYRLPTESEWEYAVKGGKYQHVFAFKYAGSNKLNEIGWYAGNSNDEIQSVGLKTQNVLGLYDMNGNVWEWCQDQWHESYENAPNDGSAWVDKSEDSYRVYRGGSFLTRADCCHSTYRRTNTPTFRYYDIGFRLVLASPSV